MTDSTRLGRFTPATSPDGGRRVALAWALVAFVLVLAFRGLYVPLALGQDEGDYATATMQALAGQSLYADQHSVRPPLLYAEYAAAYVFHERTGTGMDVTVHLLAALLVAASMAVLAYFLARRFRPVAALAGTALALLLVCSPPLQAIDANAESLMLLPYTAAGLLFWRWARGEDLASPAAEGAAAGALTVLAIMTKQVAGVLVIGLPVVFILRRRDTLRLLWPFIAAALGTTGVFVAWVAMTGQLAEWVVFGWLQNFMYAANAAGSERARIATLGLTRLRWLVGLPVAAALVPACWPRRDAAVEDRATLWFGLTWFALSAAVATMSGLFFPHYFIQVVPPLALLAALATERILDLASTVPRRPLGLLAATTFVALLLAGPAFHAAKSLIAYPALSLPTDDGLKPVVGAWVASLTAPTDRVLAYAPPRGINVYAQRLPANQVSDGSLYSMRSYAVYGDADGVRVLGIELVEPRRAIVEQWAAAAPDAILVMEPRDPAPAGAFSANERALDAELARLLARYRLVGTRVFGRFDARFYRLDRP